MSVASLSTPSLSNPLQASEPGTKLLCDLREAIEMRRLRFGDRVASIRELAKQYDISIEAVRAVLGRLEAMKFIECRHGSGTYVTFQPAELPRTASKLSGQVALLMSRRAHVYEELINELVVRLQERGVWAGALGWQDDLGLEQILPVLEGWREAPPRAVAINWAHDGLDEAMVAACRGRTRFVCVRRPPVAGAPSHSVDTDIFEVHRIAIRHAIAQGHRRIGYVTHQRAIRADQPWTLRKRKMSHTRFLLMIDEELRKVGVERGVTVFYNRLDEMDQLLGEESIGRVVEWLGRPKRPTAVIGDDFRLAPVAYAANRLGMKMPDDLLLVGMGNTPWSRSMGFASVSYEEQAMARHVAHLILSEDIDAGGGRYGVVVPPRLVLR
jgi:DNA-binding transcriptional regulator YhcF (GntR family)